MSTIRLADVLRIAAHLGMFDCRVAAESLAKLSAASKAAADVEPNVHTARRLRRAVITFDEQSKAVTEALKHKREQDYL